MSAMSTYSLHSGVTRLGQGDRPGWHPPGGWHPNEMKMWLNLERIAVRGGRTAKKVITLQTAMTRAVRKSRQKIGKITVHLKQVAQLLQRDRAVGWVSYGQKLKTVNGRQHFTDIVCLQPLWHTLCSKKSDAKIQITITMAHIIRINYPLSSFNCRLSGTNFANFNKIRHIVSEQELF